MAKQLQKLELTWIGKGNEPKLEPRILIEDPSQSYGDPNSENILIHGDNLLALKALEQHFTGQIKCICIDPPYNTGAAFEQYDDGVEHSLWLSLMSSRLINLKNLLHNKGSIWISIDDSEYAYLRVLLDEIFGRSNFVTTIIWEKRKTRENRRVFSFKHDYILVYAKDKKIFDSIRNPLPISNEVLNRYKNPDKDTRGPWQSISALAQAGHATASQFYTLVAPNGKKHEFPEGNCWRYTKNRMNEAIADNRIWFGKDGNGAPRIKKFLSESEDAGLTPETIWYADEVGTNDSAKKHSLDLFNGETVFSTPKPEELIQRILHIATNPNDWVLDSFLGSGTTSAVAHKMSRKWIGIELGDHISTHCMPRLKQVISGTDKGGITKTVNWQGGGGFKFYSLAPSLVQKDQYGNDVINPHYNANMLAAAMAKQEGFHYSPDENVYWKQGKSSEKDFIFTTTQFITVEILDKLHEEMKPDESLLICCKSYKKECERRHSNITIKKIPQMLLGRCEFGKDDYSLNIINLPNDTPAQAEDTIQQVETVEAVVKKVTTKAKKKKGSEEQPELFK